MPDWVQNRAYVESDRNYRNSQLGTLLVRRAVFREVGDFDVGYGSSTDTDWFLRTRDAGAEVVLLEEPLQLKRFHDENASADRDPSQRLRAFHASTRRKRAERAAADG